MHRHDVEYRRRYRAPGQRRAQGLRHLAELGAGFLGIRTNDGFQSAALSTRLRLRGAAASAAENERAFGVQKLCSLVIKLERTGRDDEQARRRSSSASVLARSLSEEGRGELVPAGLLEAGRQVGARGGARQHAFDLLRELNVRARGGAFGSRGRALRAAKSRCGSMPFMRSSSSRIPGLADVVAVQVVELLEVEA